MLTLFKRVLRVLERPDRARVWRLLVLSLVMGVAEVAGIGSVAPFVAVLNQPDAVETNAQLAWLYDTLQFDSVHELLVFLGVVMVALVIIRNAVFAVCIWHMTSTMSLFTHHLSTRLFTSYLHRPFPFFLSHNTLDLRRTCTEETRIAVDGVLRPLISSAAQVVTCVFVVTYLFVIDPVVAAVSIATLGGAYALVYGSLRHRLRGISRARLKHREQRLKTASAALEGIRDLLLGHEQRGFQQEFASTSSANARLEAIGRTMSQLPRFVIESAAVAALVLFMLVLAGSPGADPLPLAALYMAAGYRLLPALHQIYTNITRIRFDEASFSVLEHHLPDGGVTIAVESTRLAQPATVFAQRLELTNVSFRYPAANRDAIRDLSLAIDRNTSLALVGPTGGGKSTVLDLLSGLLAPNRGEIRVDGVPVALDSPGWQKRIGYVPQHIFLSDDTVARNIAFGVPEEEINLDAVERAARNANLHDVVMRLEHGYQTVIGEDGTRLSGGQRQRLGIARALYRAPDILLLDEATSALDTPTEDVVMESIRRLQRELTLVVVAHRLSTVRCCDNICLIEAGRVAASGSYDELARHSELFRSLAASGALSAAG